jgi:hypothetical protein
MDGSLIISFVFNFLFLEMIILLAIKFSTHLTPIVLIYYFIYFANKENFSLQQNKDNEMHNVKIFFENRSVLDMDSKRSQV